MMDELNVRLDKLIRQGNLPKATSRRIFYILERQKIPYYKALRLLVLLNKLRDDRFRDLSTAEKKKLFRNLSDLMSYRDEEKIREVCYLLLEGRLPRKSSAFFLPHDMTKSMISAGKREKSKDLKEMIWDFLLRKEIRLNEFILPDDLFFGLKAENPIFRNNTIRYLFAHFKPDTWKWY
jgi:hypothetical protein